MQAMPRASVPPVHEHPLIGSTRDKLEATRGYWKHVWRKSGTSRSWTVQFMGGKFRHPRIDTLERVSKACDEVLRAIKILDA